MPHFELTTRNDGHIRALHRAIIMASKVDKEALIQFTSTNMILCAKTDTILVKFIFNKDFFSDYQCEVPKSKCYINLKALLMPFKSYVLFSDREKEGGQRPLTHTIRCTLEDQFLSQLVFQVRAEKAAPTLTYKLNINEVDQQKRGILQATNRKIDYYRVKIAPKHSKRERFLLSAFTEFASVINQVSIRTSLSEVSFMGSCDSFLYDTTAEFTHKHEDFSKFEVKDGKMSILMPLKTLKSFLNFVEGTKIQPSSEYIFEGVGLPAHFIYETNLFKAHLITSTSPDIILEERPLPIDHFPNTSVNFGDEVCDEENVEIENDYDDAGSDRSDFLDGNLDGLNANNSIFGAESIRSEIRSGNNLATSAELIVGREKDRYEVDNLQIFYSSDSDDDEDDY